MITFIGEAGIDPGGVSREISFVILNTFGGAKKREPCFLFIQLRAAWLARVGVLPSMMWSN